MNTAIVLSGGVGSRMQSQIPKQYLDVNGKPMIYYSIKAFQDNSNIDQIIVVAAKEYIEYIKEEIVKKYSLDKVFAVIEGGKERYDSVYEGLKLIDKKSCENMSCPSGDNNCGNYMEEYKDFTMSNNLDDDKTGYTFIHDGARPCVSQNIINKCMEEVKMHRACVAAVPVKDTIKVSDENGFSISTPDRKTLWQIQTPQTFESKLIYEAYSSMYEKKDLKGVTDDAMVVEKFTDYKVKIVEAEYTNIKATTPEDMRIIADVLG